MSTYRAQPPRIRPASDAYRALIKALATGPPPLCEGNSAFIGNDLQERQKQAKTCRYCVYRKLCKEAGEEEKAGIWGGVDKAD